MSGAAPSRFKHGGGRGPTHEDESLSRMSEEAGAGDAPRLFLHVCLRPEPTSRATRRTPGRLAEQVEPSARTERTGVSIVRCVRDGDRRVRQDPACRHRESANENVLLTGARA